MGQGRDNQSQPPYYRKKLKRKDWPLCFYFFSTKIGSASLVFSNQLFITVEMRNVVKRLLFFFRIVQCRKTCFIFFYLSDSHNWIYHLVPRVNNAQLFFRYGKLLCNVVIFFLMFFLLQSFFDDSFSLIRIHLA
jgi:hypothetical protein